MRIYVTIIKEKVAINLRESKQGLQEKGRENLHTYIPTSKNYSKNLKNVSYEKEVIISLVGYN